MRFFLMAVFALVGLTGCCVDCTNTKSEYDESIEKVAELRQIIKNRTAIIIQQTESLNAIQTGQLAAENAVFLARACDYVVPICPTSVTAPGRALIAKFGVKFDTPQLLTWQIYKLSGFALILVLAGFAARLGWLFSIAPRTAEVEAAKQAVKASEDVLEAAKTKAEEILTAAYENAAEVSLEASIELAATREANERGLESLNRKKSHLAEKELEIAAKKDEIKNLEITIAGMKALGSF